MEKIDVMLVDDELLVIESIQSMLDWDASGYRIAAYALSGHEALALFEKLRPPIVLLDISIPDMSGLQIARKMFAISRTTQIILLTSYKSFDYAREAVSIGVFSYMLKHDLSPQTLRATLDGARKQLALTTARDRAQMRMTLQSFLYRASPAERAMACGLFELGGDAFALLLFRRFPCSESGASSAGLAALLVRVCSDDASGPVRPVEAADMSADTAVLLVRLEGCPWVGRAAAALRQYALESLGSCEEQLGEELLCIVSNASFAPQELPGSYHRLQELAEYSPFFGEPVIEADAASGRIGPAGAVPDPDEIVRAVTSAPDAAAVAGLTKKIFDCAFAAGWSLPGLDALRSALILSHARLRALCAMPGDLPHGVPEERPGTVRAMREWFTEEFSSLHCLVIRDWTPKVQAVVRELRRSYDQNLSAQLVADRVGISEVYLRTLLKRETGMTFLEHLTLFRMEMAKAYLKEGEYKIYEIANLVGYRDIPYFSQLFKKATGLYPFEYKEGGGRRCSPSAKRSS